MEILTCNSFKEDVTNTQFCLGVFLKVMAWHMVSRTALNK